MILSMIVMEEEAVLSQDMEDVPVMMVIMDIIVRILHHKLLLMITNSPMELLSISQFFSSSLSFSL
jgi:hypothetical protein